MKGLFGGSFDPIHFGHLSLAIELLESYQLEEILFCPAFCSPFKTAAPPVASADHRLAMLKLALDRPQWKITTVELERGGTSYTIDTIRALKIPDLRLILSQETALSLNHWKEAEKLVQLAPPLIGRREWPVSSTLIRERLQEKLYCNHLIPAPVLKYIEQHHLYTRQD